MSENQPEPEKKPEPDPTPPPAPVPAPPAPEVDTDKDDLRDIVKNLAETVTGLVTTVQSMAPLQQDKVPTKVPWTHRGGGRA
jgi:hypothetical protein